MNISDLLSWSAKRYPDKECVVEVDPETDYRKSLTYKQFDQRINRAANDMTHSAAIIMACKPYNWIDKFPPVAKVLSDIAQGVKDKWEKYLQ